MQDSAFERATPVMKQFLTAKAAYPEAILFFRMGDFYELFYDDAVVASKALELTLTARNKGAAEEIPMAGVPHHAASQYIQRLLDQGFKVAICEQMADPSKVKGLVPREVVRVVTPGIVYDDAALASGKNHFLAAVIKGASGYGVAAVDVSTGELLLTLAETEDDLRAELTRLDPRELLVTEKNGEARFRETVPKASIRTDLVPDLADLEDVLGKRASDLGAVDESSRLAAALCLGAAKRCEPGRPVPIDRISVYALADAVSLDDTTQRHLELVRTFSGESRGSLLNEIDATKTGAGARLLRAMLLAPKRNLVEIKRMQDRVELFVTHTALRAELRRELESVADIARLTTKVVNDRANPKDCAALRRSLSAAKRMLALLAPLRDREELHAFGIDDKTPWLDPCGKVFDLLDAQLAEDPPLRLVDANVIRVGFDAALDRARTLLTDGQRLVAELEGRLREETTISSLKIKYTRVFGWYLEVTRSHLEKVPDGWRRKQTVATGERYTSKELDELADAMQNAEETSQEREAELYRDLVKCLSSNAPSLFRLAERLALLDVASSLAEVAHKEDWSRPEVDESLVLAIEEGRHPVVEKLAARGKFVPNDVVLDATRDAALRKGGHLWLITGPNMAGKSTLMRQTAIIVLLAQMGSFVPAKRARVGLVDRILTRVGASDNLAQGESTFMVEMKETAGVLKKATRSSLVILDEIGRGTSTYDGLAIAWSVAEHLHDAIGCRAMFATHYHEMTELAQMHLGCANFSVSAKEREGQIVFFHRVQEGPASRSYGVACARLAGLPEVVLARAKTILTELEETGAVDARTKKKKPQMELFVPAKKSPALALLENIDVNRVTPLDAIQILAKLKELAEKQD